MDSIVPRTERWGVAPVHSVGDVGLDDGAPTRQSYEVRFEDLRSQIDTQLDVLRGILDEDLEAPRSMSVPPSLNSIVRELDLPPVILGGGE